MPAFEPSAQQALFGLVLATGGLAIAPIAVAVARRIVPERNVFFARWGFSQVAVVTLIWIASMIAAAQLARGADTDVTVALWATLASMLPPVVAIVAFAQARDPQGYACLGLWPGGHLRAMALGLFAWLCSAPALLGLGLIWPWLWERLGGHFETQRVAQQIPALTGPALVGALAVAVVLQPLLEELVFRAFLQPLLVQNLGDRGGVVVTSLVFAAAHGGSAFLPIFGLSLVLGMVMLRTQRLSAVWLVHALHNGVVLLLLIADPHARELVGGSGGEGLLGWSR
jgi:membrane protease YdiL (CAAX protease family)